MLRERKGPVSAFVLVSMQVMYSKAVLKRKASYELGTIWRMIACSLRIVCRLLAS